MPKFLITVIAFTVICWGLLIYIILGVQPSNYTSIFSFLILLFFSLSYSISIPLYFIQHKRQPGFTNLKMLYRKGLKWGMFVSFGVVGALFLKALDLLNPLNLGLFLLLYIGIFVQARGKK